MSIETRCTQCGTTNENSIDDSEYGTGNAHGTETALCTTCSETCGLDECLDDDPCERCRVETVQNRCGKSVPTAQH
jgi:hypothetical protein